MSSLDQPPIPELIVDGATHGEVIGHLHEGVYYVDCLRRIRFWNAGAERITGYRAAEVVDRRCHDNILNHVDSAGRALCADGCPLLATIRDGAARDAEVFLRHRTGYRVGVRIRTAPLRNAQGVITGAVEVFTDDADLVAAREEATRLRGLALTDALTGLPNRRYLTTAIESWLAGSERTGRPFGLLLADVDHFKMINDRHGHGAGDETLRVVARSLVAGTRGDDVIGRWGGEEFLGLAAGANLAGARLAAERLRVLVARSEVRVADSVVHPTISVGVTVASAHDTAAMAVDRADRALYRAKSRGRNRVEVEDS